MHKFKQCRKVLHDNGNTVSTENLACVLTNIQKAPMQSKNAMHVRTHLLRHIERSFVRVLGGRNCPGARTRPITAFHLAQPHSQRHGVHIYRDTAYVSFIQSIPMLAGPQTIT